jgi:hypothetical protein
MRLIEILRWPVVVLAVTGALHFAAEAALPDLKSNFGPGTLAPLFLVYGLWTGSSAVAAGASIWEAILAGLILGLMPLALDIVGFGFVLGRGTDAGLLNGVFGLLVIVFGTLAGAGWATSQARGREPAPRAG